MIHFCNAASTCFVCSVCGCHHMHLLHPGRMICPVRGLFGNVVSLQVVPLTFDCNIPRCWSIQPSAKPRTIAYAAAQQCMLVETVKAPHSLNISVCRPALTNLCLLSVLELDCQWQPARVFISVHAADHHESHVITSLQLTGPLIALLVIHTLVHLGTYSHTLHGSLPLIRHRTVARHACQASPGLRYPSTSLTEAIEAWTSRHFVDTSGHFAYCMVPDSFPQESTRHKLGVKSSKIQGVSSGIWSDQIPEGSFSWCIC